MPIKAQMPSQQPKPPRGTAHNAKLGVNMSPRVSIVCTTIFDLKFLESLATNLSAYDRVSETQVVVIPDLKSPASSFDTARALRSRGYDIIYPDITEQEQFLKRFSPLSDLIPYNSDNRRNVGFLFALLSGSEVIISMDDDNYPLMEQDFVGCHSIVGSEYSGLHVISSNSWFNICSELRFETQGSVFPAWFPLQGKKGSIAGLFECVRHVTSWSKCGTVDWRSRH